MSIVYIKMLHYHNGLIHTKQKVCTVISEDDNNETITVKMYNNEVKDYEIRVLMKGQYSVHPYLMDFD
jgi:hypothetical protein